MQLWYVLFSDSVHSVSREPPHWRARSLLASSSPSHCPLCSRNGPRETSTLCTVAHRSLRGRLGPETVSDRDPGQGKVESRGISATPCQRRSCRPPDEFVFGASPVLRQTLRGRTTRRPGSIAAILAASSTPASCSLTRLIGCPKPCPER